MPDSHPARTESADPSVNESIKETIESIVIAFILAFVFRAYVVEAFVIPTGSMAPTLLGQHFRISCHQCGYEFTTDLPGNRDGATQLGYDTAAVCPMCHYPNPLSRGARPRAGDRILVHKYIYTLSEPRRWDVVVFKNPTKPEENYIKRLVGLPSEKLAIVEGNIYVQPDGQDQWTIARKADRPKVQEAVWQPVYHGRYVPLDGGADRYERQGFTWSMPWTPSDPPSWTFDGGVYRFAGANGELRFDFNLDYVSHSRPPTRYAYNQLKSQNAFEPIEDLRLGATVVPGDKPIKLMLQTTARLDAAGASDRVQARFDGDGDVKLVRVAEDGAQTLLAEGRGEAFAGGRPVRVELTYVDQAVTVSVDGRVAASWAYDLTLEEVLRRPGPRPYPDVRIQIGGGGATLHDVNLDRDLHYSSRGNTFARGGFIKYKDGTYAGEPVAIGSDLFFCLGDNSPMSHDSRYWSTVHAWIEERMLMNKPEADRIGFVPRRLMMGRAFFVYFPAPYRFGKNPWAVIPNFGDLRFIH